jgi:hypothetical protein
MFHKAVTRKHPIAYATFIEARLILRMIEYFLIYRGIKSVLIIHSLQRMKNGYQ